MNDIIETHHKSSLGLYLREIEDTGPLHLRTVTLVSSTSTLAQLRGQQQRQMGPYFSNNSTPTFTEAVLCQDLQMVSTEYSVRSLQGAHSPEGRQTANKKPVRMC